MQNFTAFPLSKFKRSQSLCSPSVNMLLRVFKNTTANAVLSFSLLLKNNLFKWKKHTLLIQYACSTFFYLFLLRKQWWGENQHWFDCQSFIYGIASSVPISFYETGILTIWAIIHQEMLPYKPHWNKCELHIKGAPFILMGLHSRMSCWIFICLRHFKAAFLQKTELKTDCTRNTLTEKSEVIPNWDYAGWLSWHVFYMLHKQLQQFIWAQV